MTAITRQKYDTKQEIITLLEYVAQGTGEDELRENFLGLARTTMSLMKLWELADWRDRLVKVYGDSALRAAKGVE